MADEEKLILSADVSRLIKPLQQAADFLGKMDSLIGSTDSQLGKIERTAQQAGAGLQKLVNGLKDSTSATKAAGSGADKYSEKLQGVIGQLGELEKKSRTISLGKLEDVQLPASLQGRSASGQFTKADVSALSTADLNQITKAYDLQRETLESLARTEVKRRATVKAMADAERQAAADLKQRETSGRGYLNSSTGSDAFIAAQEKAGRDFSTQLRAQMQEQQRATALTKADTNARHENTGSLISARYALYDVATTYAAIGTALLGSAAIAIKTGADFESAFTNVERTLENGQSVRQINDIRQGLVDLSTQIPKTFDEIAGIATLGNQLGVAAADVEGFTETVSQFSTVTGITADASAQAFGRIGNILDVATSDYDRLASSITYVGRTSAATEAQIIALTERLGASADRAGFTAAEVVGLSGALASLGVAPERAQGVFETYFNTLNEAVAAGGEKLENFATITGLTGDAIDEMVRSGQGLEVFNRFVAGLESKDTVELTTALDNLGLSGLRANEVIGRISQGLPLLNTSLANSTTAWNENTELADQYALILDDLNTQFMLLVNAANALVAELSGGLVPGVAGAVAEMVNFVNQLREIAKNPAVKAIAALVGGIAVAVGVFFAYSAAVAFANASTLALVTAQTQLALISAGGTQLGIRGMIAALLGLAGSASAATASTATLTYATAGTNAALGLTTPIAARAAGALTAVGTAARAAMIPALIGAAAVIIALPFAQMISDSASAAQGLRDITTAAQASDASMRQLGDALQSSLTKIGDYEDDISGVNGGVEQLNANVNDFFNQWFDATPGLTDAREQLGLIDGQLASMVGSGNLAGAAGLLATTGYSAAEAAKKFPAYTKALLEARAATALAGNLGLMNQAFHASEIAADKASGAISGVGKSAGGTAKQVRTLTDYASDLSSVFTRAFEIRFGSQEAVDKVTSSFADLTDRINDASVALLKLTADKNVKEYFLSVANAYGDSLRAGVLTGEIAEINSKIAETQADASTELQGNSKAAIKNRAAMAKLVGEYQDYITALAAGGADQNTLNAAVAQSQMEFMSQAAALGYSNAQLQPYIASFGDMATAISRIPRNITVTATTDPAMQAINEFLARAKSAIGSGINIPVTGVVDKGARDALFTQWATATQKQYGRALAQSASGWVEVRRLWEAGAYGKFSEGGYTGAGGKFQPAGVVHKGEYVVPKQHVNQSTGLPDANYLGRISSGYAAPRQSMGYAGGGYVGGGMGVMQLSPRDRAIMANGRGDVIIQIDGREIARAVNNVNKQDQYTGAG